MMSLLFSNQIIAFNNLTLNVKYFNNTPYYYHVLTEKCLPIFSYSNEQFSEYIQYPIYSYHNINIVLDQNIVSARFITTGARNCDTLTIYCDKNSDIDGYIQELIKYKNFIQVKNIKFKNADKNLITPLMDLNIFRSIKVSCSEQKTLKIDSLLLDSKDYKSAIFWSDVATDKLDNINCVKLCPQFHTEKIVILFCGMCKDQKLIIKPYKNFEIEEFIQFIINKKNMIRFKSIKFIGVAEPLLQPLKDSQIFDIIEIC